MKNPVGDHISPRKIPAELWRAQPSFRWPVSVAIDALFGSNGWFYPIHVNQFCLLKSGNKKTTAIQQLIVVMIFAFNSIYVGSRSLLGHHSARWRHPGRISRWGPYVFVRNSEGCCPQFAWTSPWEYRCPCYFVGESRWTLGVLKLEILHLLNRCHKNIQVTKSICSTVFQPFKI